MGAPAAAPDLYVHVPFCRAKCRYCAFFSAPPRRGDASAYVASLLAEIAFWGRRLGRFPAPGAPTLFFGGGTPSLLEPQALGRILAALRAAFGLAEDAEISLEANPDSATPEFLAAARRLGVNRVSLGVQSLDDADLRALGRIHDAQEAVAAFRAARAAGFANVGLDLMFGLPGQRLDAWLATLRRAADLGPEHLSCYGLTIEPGTPLARDAAALAALPDDDVQAEMFLRGGELLAAAGYRRYEISNFARPGRECRHNLNCWRGRDCLALGPAAVTTLAGARWTDPPDLAAWTQTVDAGRLGATSREELGRDVRGREAAMLALRTAEGLDLADLARRFGLDLVRGRAALLADLARAGLARRTGSRFGLTPKGMLVSSAVTRALVFSDEKKNHS